MEKNWINCSSSLIKTLNELAEDEGLHKAVSVAEGWHHTLLDIAESSGLSSNSDEFKAAKLLIDSITKFIDANVPYLV